MALLEARGVLFQPFEPGEECLVGTGVRVEPDHRKPEPGAEEREHDDSRNAEKARNSRGCASRHQRSPLAPRITGLAENAACTAASSLLFGSARAPSLGPKPDVRPPLGRITRD